MNIKGRCNSTGDLNGGTLAAGAERHEMWPAAIGHIPPCGRHRAVHPLVFNYENGLYLRNAILHIKLSTNIERASVRERVVMYVYIAVLGRSLKKQQL